MNSTKSTYTLPEIPEVKFGRYPQRKDGTFKDIEWYAFYEDYSGKALLFSKYALDCRPYNETSESNTTWENCSLRKWLNEDFLDVAFSDEEKNAITLSKVVNTDSPNGGNDTYDRVFLLSVSEIDRLDRIYLGFTLGISNRGHVSHQERSALCRHPRRKWWATPYAKARGSRLFYGKDYWLRTSAGMFEKWQKKYRGQKSCHAASVGCGNSLFGVGPDINESCSVRPALTIDWTRFPPAAPKNPVFSPRFSQNR